jgi:hypothetical protein
VKRKFKRNTDRMSFVITCRAWKALFQDKENNKKEKLSKPERNEVREKKKEVIKGHSR